VSKLARDGGASKRSISHAMFGLFRKTMAYKSTFHAYSTILDSFFYGYSAIVDSVVIVSFFLRNIHFAVLSLTNKLSLYNIMPMFSSRCLVFCV